MKTNLRTLGPAESKVVLTLREQGRQVVDAADILRLLGSGRSGRKVIQNLIRKGWLSRIVGGRYMFLPPEHGPENLGENNILALAAGAVDPSYIGWWSAASRHGFTTQKPMTVFVATLKQVPAREIEGNPVRFIKVTPRKFFGYLTYKVFDRPVAISTPAKTLIDCLDRPDLCGGATELTRITHAALSKVEPNDVLEAALPMKSKALLQRLGFLSDLVGRPLPDHVRAALRAAIPKGYHFHFGHDKRRDHDIGYVAEWGLFVNARRKDLLAEVPGANA
ncbi:type IV toxin-antitoxin system AbiEi family antitoxin [Hyphomicrobium sp.]|uniref:type IV toxin-antitoxin system AbiEi family antitoxin domain-containing protein n=1 Tax=Hyphomicrobium sp. TaxID=82 RepID=UPI000F9A67B4|nr:type IV toxin-antitoxin system AbiEi family antitoxin [Hyphomicrobium sp.]RUP07822.1 MAG: transcriptional regulator [Hyphomicrobium sp.]